MHLKWLSQLHTSRSDKIFVWPINSDCFLNNRIWISLSTKFARSKETVVWRKCIKFCNMSWVYMWLIQWKQVKCCKKCDRIVWMFRWSDNWTCANAIGCVALVRSCFPWCECSSEPEGVYVPICLCLSCAQRFRKPSRCCGGEVFVQQYPWSIVV